MAKPAPTRRLETLSRHLLPPQIAPQGPLLQSPTSYSDQVADDSYPVIIGGMVLDVNAMPNSQPLPGTTTPGKVQYVNGGVARNVAECMSKLGTKPFIISVVGLDIAGELLLKYWKSAKLSTEGIRRHQDITTPIVSNIYDSTGELAAAVASIEAVEKFLSPEWIWQFWRHIRSAPVVMIDANLHPQSLEAACQSAGYGVPVWFEPVSITKSARIASFVNYITYVSPNASEIVSMANALSSSNKVYPLTTKGEVQSVETLFQMLKPAICIVLEKGVKMLVVTLGSYGVFLCCREGPDFIKEAFGRSRTTSCGGQLYQIVNQSCLSKQFVYPIKTTPASPLQYAYHFPAPSASVVSLTGAGDCLVGGALASICAGLDKMQSIAVGMAVAKATVETDANVPTDYSLSTIADEATKILLAAKPLSFD